MGPFARGSPDDSLLLSQTFMGVAGATALLLAAITSERRQAESELRRAHDRLEGKVEERTAELERSHKELELQGLIARNMAEGVCLVRASDSAIVYANPEFERMFGYEPGRAEREARRDAQLRRWRRRGRRRCARGITRTAGALGRSHLRGPEQEEGRDAVLVPSAHVLVRPPRVREGLGRRSRGHHGAQARRRAGAKLRSRAPARDTRRAAGGALRARRRRRRGRRRLVRRARDRRRQHRRSRSATSPGEAFRRRRSWRSCATPCAPTRSRRIRPAVALERLNRLAWTLDRSVMATLVYLVFDPGSGVVRLANAGHLPPLQANRTGPPRIWSRDDRFRSGSRRATTYSEAEYLLEPGSTLLLYTDGLVEKRARPIDDGLATPCRSA